MLTSPLGQEKLRREKKEEYLQRSKDLVCKSGWAPEEMKMWFPLNQNRPLVEVKFAHLGGWREGAVCRVFGKNVCPLSAREPHV